jgi:hypothetical protein
VAALPPAAAAVAHAGCVVRGVAVAGAPVQALRHPAPVVGGVHEKPYGYLALAALAGGEVGVLAGAGKPGEDEGGEQGDDGDDHQQLDQRETLHNIPPQTM